MPVPLLIQTLGVIAACSAASYGIEHVPSVHPVVRRGVQLGFCFLTGWYVAHLFGFIV